MVIDEADFCRKQGKELFSVFVEKVEPPLQFGGLARSFLSNWDRSPQDPGYRELVSRLAKLLGSNTSPSRVPHLSINNKTLALPAFIRSVSSFETQIRPDAALQMIALSGTDPLLVSAYDLGSQGVIEQLKKCASKDIFIMMDSGNYESYRKDDPKWFENPAKFAEAFAKAPCDIAFCHDRVVKFPKGSAAPTAQHVADQIIAATKRDIAATGSERIVPIVHAPREETTDYVSALLPEICYRVAASLRPILIAVPERELGPGLIRRARLVHEIRSKLNTLGWYQPLHLLGTGNPLSIALLCAAGADICDGLEWCRTVIDRDTFRLFHYQQYDFFVDQAGSARSPIVRMALEDAHVPYAAKVGFHNLEVFADFETQLRAGIQRKAPQEILIHMCSKAAFDAKVRPALPEVFGR